MEEDAASNIAWHIFRWNCAFFNNSSLETHTQYARQRKRKPDLSTFPNKCLITHIRDRGRNTIPRPFLPPAPSSSLHLAMFIFYSWTLGLPPLFSLIALRAPSIPSSLMREQRKATKTARYSLARARAATLFPPRLLARSHPPVLIFHCCLRGEKRERGREHVRRARRNESGWRFARTARDLNFIKPRVHAPALIPMAPRLAYPILVSVVAWIIRKPRGHVPLGAPANDADCLY